MRALPRFLAVATATVAGLIVTPTLARAVTGHGYDVSWPQCGRSLPSDGDFRIVGVNGGKPYEENPCLAQQYRWATGAPGAAFYVNTANPGPESQAVDWYGQRLPNVNCSPSNEPACAYNYGYNGAKHAWAYAQRATGAAARHSWWLDVETMNSWSDDRGQNVASIAGAAAYLKSQGVPVGVYSTQYQWDRITGGARMPDLPNWVAGARNAGEAASWCGPESSFAGGQVTLIQWVDHDLDHNHACAPLPAVTGAPTGPKGLDQIVKDVLELVPKLLADLNKK